MSRQFQVSRTPIREALIRLKSEGLVTIIRNKGAFVKDITFKDIVEIFQMRILLEGYAAFCCIDYLDPNQVAAIRSRLIELHEKSGSPEEISKVGVSLHNVIRDNCGNGRLKNFITTIESQILWTRAFAYRIPGRTTRSYQEHISLANAILDGDKNEAKRTMEKHLENTFREVVKVENILMPFSPEPQDYAPRPQRDEEKEDTGEPQVDPLQND